MNNKQFALIIVSVLLAASSVKAMAAWILYADMDGGQGYYDPKTIKWVSNTKVNVLTYINLPEEKVSFNPEGGKKVVFSNKALQQYDCEGSTYAFLETELYSDYNLKGNIIKRNQKKKLEPKPIGKASPVAIGKGSPAASLVKTLCQNYRSVIK
jgi:hypothetical protein